MNKSNLLNKRSILLFIILFIVGEIILLLITGNEPKTVEQSKESLEKYAKQVVEKCKEASFHPSCYDKEIPKLTDKISMEDAFKVASLVQKSDSSYNYCHVLGHELSAQEVKKDPSNWKDVLQRCPFAQCANGCQHGLIQEVFRSEYLDLKQLDKLEIELQDLCEAKHDWQPTPFERAHCYHGIGHALLYTNPKQIPKLLDMCDSIAIKKDGSDLASLCYEGLFMQIFQPLEPEDFALVKGVTPEKKDLEKFCLQFAEGKKRNACWNQGWPLFRAEIISSPTNLVEYCKNLSFTSNYDRCSKTLFHVVGQDNRFDVDKIDAYCSSATTETKAECYYNAASSIMQAESTFIPKAVEMCKRAGFQGQELGNYCFEQIVNFSTYNYHFGSELFTNLCNSLPEKWRIACLNKEIRTSNTSPIVTN